MSGINLNTEKLNTVLFDLDGTLLDSFAVHYDVYKVMFAHFGITLEKEKFLDGYSPNWYKTYEALGLPQDEWQIADDIWVKEAKKRKPVMLPGAIDTLTKLVESFYLGLVTSGSKSRVERDLASNEIRNFFRTIITGDDIQHPKPHPEGLEMALSNLGSHPEQAIYIGDSYADFQMAKAANVSFLGIRSEFMSLKEDHPEYRLCKLTELPKLLNLEKAGSE